MKHLGKNFRAISPVLAVLMMIAVAIAGSLLVYAWVMGYIGFSTEKSGQTIKIHCIANSGGDLGVYVQNVGEGVVQLEEADCLYVNGNLALCSITGVPVSGGVATLSEGETATLTLVGGAALPGEKIDVKVTTVLGVSDEMSAYPAGYVRAEPVLDHFTFTPIASPQTSGVPFNVTVRAVDQYGERFMNYSDINSLGYSGWDISPSVTGNFVGGVWSGEVNVTGSATDAVITTVAQVNSSWTGTSNTFNVSGVAEMLWNKTYGRTGPYRDGDYALVKTPDGGYAIAGYTRSYGMGGSDFWLIKTDEYGNMEWNRTYGGPADECAYSLVVTSDAGFALAGPIENVSEHGAVWLVKTDSYGNMEWNRTYVGLNADVEGSSSPLVKTSDGGYALAGYTVSVAGDTDFCLIKTDDLGNVEWNRTYGGSEDESAFSVVATSDGCYALAGETESFGAGSEDVWLVKTNASGYMEWNRTYGGIYEDIVHSVVEVSGGGYAIAGMTTSFSVAGDDVWLVKTNAYGNVEWNRTYGGYGNQVAYSLIVTSDGRYTLAGYTSSSDPYGADFLLVKTDEGGNLLWNQTYGKQSSSPLSNIEYAYCVLEADNGGYMIAGNRFTPYGDCWLVKTDKYTITQ